MLNYHLPTQGGSSLRLTTHMNTRAPPRPIKRQISIGGNGGGLTLPVALLSAVAVPTTQALRLRLTALVKVPASASLVF